MVMYHTTSDIYHAYIYACTLKDVLEYFRVTTANLITRTKTANQKVVFSGHITIQQEKMSFGFQKSFK